jgi:tetratricopeptide (TPR) repeat protein
MVAALFALHPMHVESVAWVAERKDVLSTFFFILTLWAYTRYAQKSKAKRLDAGVQSPKSKVQTPGLRHRISWDYALALILFALGLLSKPMLVTVPFLLLLLDLWPLGRIEFKKGKPTITENLPLMLEKVPFLLLSVVSSVITFVAQRSGGSVASLELFSFDSRLENALAAYVGYLQKLVWPSKLAVLYLPAVEWPVWQLGLGLVLMVGITTAVLTQIRMRSYLAVGWFWFVGTLVPVIGLVQVGSQYMADRYSYVPYIGCFICLVWGVWDLVSRFSTKGHPKLVSSPPQTDRNEGKGASAPALSKAAHISSWGRLLAGLACVLVLGALAIVTRNQLEYWRTSETLFRHCIEVTKDNYIAYNNLGAFLVNQHRYTEAKPLYTEALHINPKFPDALINMGTLLALQGDITNALSYLQQGVQLAPASAESIGKLGVALAEQGRMSDAVACYRESLRLNPNQIPACNNLAWILATNPDTQLRNGAEAVAWGEHACKLTDYVQPMLIGTLAAAYAEAGRFPEAVSAAQRAIHLASAAGQTDLAQKNRQLLELYRAGEPYREEVKQ